MITLIDGRKKCEKCNKTMGEEQFYTYKTGEKTEQCKKCLTMHIDNFDEKTFLWILEKMDMPYVKEEWDVLRDRAFAKNPNLTGMSVFGKYMGKMRLKQWKDYTYADSERLQQDRIEKSNIKEEERKEHENKLLEDYNNGKISEAEYKTLTSAETQYIQHINAPVQLPQQELYNEDSFVGEDFFNELESELTLEDKKVLAMKWGRHYKIGEWIELERSYNEMMNSFDIQDADTLNTLILLCKTKLKMNQFIDESDIEGFQKLSKVYESLRKSAKFTAAQNKEEKGDAVDSIGEIVEICEKQGFIPRFATDIPNDKVDFTLKDMKNYTYKLVTQDLGFGQQIENALKKIELQRKADSDSVNMLDENEDELEDQDFLDFNEDIQDQIEEDIEMQKGDF